MSSHSAAPGSDQTAHWCPSLPGDTAAPVSPYRLDPQTPDRAALLGWPFPLDSCQLLKVQRARAGPILVPALDPASLYALHPELHPVFGRGSLGPQFGSVEVWRRRKWLPCRQKSGFLGLDSWGRNKNLIRKAGFQLSTCLSACLLIYLCSERRKSSRWGPPLPRGSSGTMKWSPTNVYWRSLRG